MKKKKRDAVDVRNDDEEHSNCQFWVVEVKSKNSRNLAAAAAASANARTTVVNNNTRDRAVTIPFQTAASAVRRKNYESAQSSSEFGFVRSRKAATPIATPIATATATPTTLSQQY